MEKTNKEDVIKINTNSFFIPGKKELGEIAIPCELGKKYSISIDDSEETFIGCGHKPLKKTGFYSHARKHLNRSYICPYPDCKKEFPELTNFMNNHFQQIHNFCVICYKSLENYKEFNKHLITEEHKTKKNQLENF